MPKQGNLPKWLTPERKQRLVELFIRSGGFCVFGHKECLIPHHHFELFIEELIADWIASDREQRQAEWQAELDSLHTLFERKQPLRGRFSAISQEIWRATKPVAYIESLGISGLTLKPFAKVRLSSSYLRLHIDLGEALRTISKSKRRKAIRYGKPLPPHIEDKVASIVGQAIEHYLTH